MLNINIPAFGEKDFSSNIAGKAHVFVIRGAGAEGFSGYESLLKDAGYGKREERYTDGHSYAAFCGEGAVYMNYYSAIDELYIVFEEDTSYFSYSDEKGGYDLPALVTQLELEDFGMCYVIRLPDGRFIVIDGGQGFLPDQKRLLACLKEQTVCGVPTIAAWILTHPHSDHFNAFADFNERYLEEVFIEKVLYNFPDKDDTVHLTDNINATSTVIRMELCGQVILWAADAGCGFARLAEKQGEHLKADILQVPHHGFGCGGADEEIAAYKLIAPRVCFMSVSDHNAYTVFCTFRAGARYLMTEAGIEELITGTPTRTVALPYTPPAGSAEALRRKFLSGLDNCGSPTWIFTELSTAVPSDFEFTLLNTANSTVTVWIELFFEDPKQKIRFIKAKVNPTSLKRLSIVGEDVDPDALHFNWLSLKAQGIPENVPFAVRFMSDTPIIVSHKNHAPTYHSQNR